MALLDYISVLCMSDPGGGKSTMFSTFPASRSEGKRMVVYGMDPRSNMKPYIASCCPGAMPPYTDVDADKIEVKRGKVKTAHGPVKFTNVVGPEREVRIYHFSDPDPTKPKAWEQFKDVFRMVDHDKSSTEVFDSITAAAIYAYKWYEYGLWPRPKGYRPKRGEDIPHPSMGATDELEEFLCCQLPTLDCHIGAAAHFSNKEIEFQGSLLRAPNAPGRLRQTMAGFFSEVYVLRVLPIGSRKVRFLLCESDDEFMAKSTEHVPNFTEPTFDGIANKRPVKDKLKVMKELGLKVQNLIKKRKDDK